MPFSKVVCPVFIVENTKKQKNTEDHLGKNTKIPGSNFTAQSTITDKGHRGMRFKK